MRIPLFSNFTLAAMAVLLGSFAMNADTIDTFDFTQGGWENGTTGQLTGVILTGTFAGTLEPSGLIEAADLTHFSAQLTVPNASTAVFDTIDPLSTGGQPFFSYNINGGNSSLDFVASGPGGLMCEGAVVELDPAACFASSAFPNAFGYSQDFGVSLEQATVTLVSSVTSNPSSPSGGANTPTNPVPEPASVALLGIGCLVLGMLPKRSCRTAARSIRQPISPSARL